MVRRFGRVIGLKEKDLEAYKALHAGPGVRDLLTEANMRNFNIFVHRLPDGQLYEFMYVEYVGDDMASDMARLSANPRNAEWLTLCNPMQIPLPGHTGWADMESVFFNA